MPRASLLLFFGRRTDQSQRQRDPCRRPTMTILSLVCASGVNEREIETETFAGVVGRLLVYLLVLAW